MADLLRARHGDRGSQRRWAVKAGQGGGSTSDGGEKRTTSAAVRVAAVIGVWGVSSGARQRGGRVALSNGPAYASGPPTGLADGLGLESAPITGVICAPGSRPHAGSRIGSPAPDRAAGIRLQRFRLSRGGLTVKGGRRTRNVSPRPVRSIQSHTDLRGITRIK